MGGLSHWRLQTCSHSGLSRKMFGKLT
ncbi:hypothetical protein MAR_034828 [Mya arenaria]|uniref:Uncharacterized protein n=1 Tax=Mya arenaria TaxID=6604 RepID=A0ABY7EL90_MYAAR|nr:hypothetical protein MAR_034828 [Mya arenaria]